MVHFALLPDARADEDPDAPAVADDLSGLEQRRVPLKRSGRAAASAA